MRLRGQALPTQMPFVLAQFLTDAGPDSPESAIDGPGSLGFEPKGAGNAVPFSGLKLPLSGVAPK